MDAKVKAAVEQAPNLRTGALEELKAQLVEEYRTARAQELSVDGVAALAELAAAIDAVSTELANREDDAAAAAESEAAEAAAAEELAAAAADLDEKVAGVEAKPAEETAELAADEAEADEVKAEEAPEAAAEEAVVAAAEEPVGEIAPDGLASSEVPEGQEVAAIVASADIPGIQAGTRFGTMHDVAEAFIQRRGTLRGVSRDGDGDRVIVASIEGNFPEERKLNNDLAANEAKIEAVTNPEVITASGGLCAPLEPYYGIQVIADAARPVRDALAKFGADRGGVRFLPPPQLSDLESAVATTTAAEDEGPYPSPTPYKPCLHVTCPSEETAEITAIHRCLTFGNFAARTYPEQVEAWLALAIAQHARVAEGYLLDGIAAASTAVTAAQVYGATASLLSQVDQASARYRSYHRMRPSTQLRILLPDWAKELIRVDLARSYQGTDLTPLYVSDAQILSWFSARNVNVTFYLDTPTGAGQVWGAQGAGALVAFPTTVVWFLYVEGSFVHLDGGTLDLGLVRDSELNKTNDYQVFAETFENVAFFGIESLKITSTVCPDGSHSPAASGLVTC